jgi:hypothetical protein
MNSLTLSTSSLVRELARDVDTLRWLDELLQDTRYGAADLGSPDLDGVTTS